MNIGIVVMIIVITFLISFAILIIISNKLEAKEEIKRKKEFAQKEKNKFENLNIEKTKIIKGNGYTLVFDNVNNKFAITTDRFDKFHIYNYSDFVECQVIKDDGQIYEKDGTAGKAILGSLFLGTAGAIAGMSGAKKTTIRNVVYSLSVRILVRNIQKPFYQLDFIDRECEVGSEVYNKVIKKATEIITTFDLIKEKCNNDSKKT